MTAQSVTLETQQSSDTTYRIYDYDRVDKKTGKKRALHLKQSIDVTTVPFKEPELHIQSGIIGDSKVTTLITQPDSPFFSVYKWEVNGELIRKHEHGPYTLMSVINGEGTLTADGKTYQLKKGIHLLMPATINEWKLDGKMLIIASESVE